MSAETLRRAAALMRERAEAATGATYHWRVGRIGKDQNGLVACGKVQIAYTDERIGQPLRNAEHIAGMHPAVALAVADWLDMAADHALGRGEPCESCVDQALTVATTYLGESS